jgi:hypothetical protein
MFEELFKSPFSVGLEASFIIYEGICLSLGHMRQFIERGVDTVREKVRLHCDEHLALVIVFFST